MRNISTFHRLATAAVEKTAGGNAEGQKITLNVIKQRLGDTLYKLTSQKFEDPGAFQAAPAACCTPCCSARQLVACRPPGRRALGSLLARQSWALTCACPARLVCAAEGEDAVRRKLRAVYEELTERFRALEDDFR
jgi:V-type H+-transporting ATPase subunit A